MNPPDPPPSPASKRPWINRSLLAIVCATFFSDVSHEMCTAVLPLYMAALGLGPAALGLMEGLADFLVSISKLAGGIVGHHVPRKRPLAALGYLVTTLATWGMAFVGHLAALVTLRGVAWIGRGFRSPLRDYLLADAVEKEFYGRAYGLERAGDMLGAVVGPLAAAAFLWAGAELRCVLYWTLLPGLAAAAVFYFFTRERPTVPEPAAHEKNHPRPPFPWEFKLFLVGVFLFGLGDFSRTFLVWLAAGALGIGDGLAGGTLSVVVSLYLVHNLVSAAAAYPAGHLGDRRSKIHVLIGGYGLGVLTNLLLALQAGSLAWLIPAICLSGIYIAVEETLEKAVAAEMLPRELRSLGFGILACGNAVGDMVSSLYVGLLLEGGYPEVAFGIAAFFGAVGFAWLSFWTRKK